VYKFYIILLHFTSFYCIQQVSLKSGKTLPKKEKLLPNFFIDKQFGFIYQFICCTKKTNDILPRQNGTRCDFCSTFAR
jgi:hypothetical protein